MRNRVFWHHATQYVARHVAAPQLLGGDLNFDLNHLLRASSFVLASLLVRRLVDADLEFESVLMRVCLCAYQGPEGTSLWRIDGPALQLHAEELLPRGATPVRFDPHLKGVSERVVKFIHPKAVELAPREEDEWLLFTQRLL